MARIVLCLALVAPCIGCLGETDADERRAGAVEGLDSLPAMRYPVELVPPTPGAQSSTGELRVAGPYGGKFSWSPRLPVHRFVLGGDAALVRIRITTFGTFVPALGLATEARAVVDRSWLHLFEEQSWPRRSIEGWALVDRDLVTIDRDRGVYELTIVRDARTPRWNPLILYLTTDELQRAGGVGAPPTDGRYEIELLNLEAVQDLCGEVGVRRLDLDSRLVTTTPVDGQARALFDGDPATGVTFDLGPDSGDALAVEVAPCHAPADPVSLFVTTAVVRFPAGQHAPHSIEFTARNGEGFVDVESEAFDRKTADATTWRVEFAVDEPVRRIAWPYRISNDGWSLFWGETVEVRDLALRGIAVQALSTARAIDLRWPPTAEGWRRF